MRTLQLSPPRLLSVLLAGLVLAAAPTVLTGCDAGDSDDGGLFSIETYLGTYTGTSTTTSQVGGVSQTVVQPASVVVARGAVEGEGTVTLDLGPAAPGADDPAPIVLEGTYDEDGVELRFPDDNVSLVVRVDADGDISGNGTAPVFDLTVELEADGRATADSFDLSIGAVVTTGNDDVPVGSSFSVVIEADR